MREGQRGRSLPWGQGTYTHLADSIGRSTSYILVGSHGLFGPRTSDGLISLSFSSIVRGQDKSVSKRGTPWACDSSMTRLTFGNLADNSDCAASRTFLFEDFVLATRFRAFFATS